MANKFQKSIQERLEQEAARQKVDKKTTKPTKEPQEVLPPPTKMQTEKLEKSDITPSPEPVAASAQTPRISPDIRDYLPQEPQRTAKNKTFYLDEEVISAIKTSARSQGLTDSKLVNSILRRVLGLNTH